MRGNSNRYTNAHATKDGECGPRPVLRVGLQLRENISGAGTGARTALGQGRERVRKISLRPQRLGEGGEGAEERIGKQTPNKENPL